MTKLGRISQQVLDFIVGVLLIGFAPAATPFCLVKIVYFLVEVVGRVDHKAFSMSMFEGATYIIAGLSIPIVFGFSIYYRLWHRVLPKWVLTLEILFGVIMFLIVWALVFIPP